MLAGVNRGSWCYIMPTTLAIKPPESVALVRIKVLARWIVYAALYHLFRLLAFGRVGGGGSRNFREPTPI